MRPYKGISGVIRAMVMDDASLLRPTSGASLAELARQLGDARAHTLRLTQDLTPQQLMGPMLPIVNPVLWEIGHIAWFHEYWTLRHVHGAEPLVERGDRLWDSSTVAHATRWDLDLPHRDGTARFMAEVLERQLDRLGGGIGEAARYFYELVIRHEDMHAEALAYTRQTLGYFPPPLAGEVDRAAARSGGGFMGDASVPGGRWRLGATQTDGFIFDNEKWAHEIALAPFRIAKAPVTNAEYAEFVAAGGYGAREFWSEPGWQWREREQRERPAYWLPQHHGVWTWRRHGRIEALARDAPVAFVNWYEAEAWCRWAKRRLPAEAEWEAAAIGEPDASSTHLSETKRRWPWGEAPPEPNRANLDFALGAPLDVGACADGDSAFGCRQMIGNVWEWTASDFVPFDGFAPDPYADYSAPWFGTRKVLRGGCWATSRRIARPAYRNFFTPDRSDVIAGFRTCAI